MVRTTEDLNRVLPAYQRTGEGKIDTKCQDFFGSCLIKKVPLSPGGFGL